MYAIVFYTFLIEDYRDNRDLSIEIYRSYQDKTTEYLNGFQFYSLDQKRYLESQAQTESEHEALMSEFDKNNQKTINEILQIFKALSDFDLLRTTNCLNQFKDNLNWDGGFILRLISLDFDSLIDTTIDQRKKLISEIIEIFERYKSEPKDDKNIEFYD